MIIYSTIYKDWAHLDCLGSPEMVYHPDQLESSNAVLILHGGEDISPCLYNQKANKYSGSTDIMSRRDQIEHAIVSRAINMGIPIFGICRGAQFLTAIAGGSLVQHVMGHVGGKHMITTNDGRDMMASSAHHQMCNPAGTTHELLAWSTIRRSIVYLGENEADVPMKTEPEVIYYPKIKALAVQGHPEWMSPKSEFVQYCIELVKSKLIPHTLIKERAA